MRLFLLGCVTALAFGNPASAASLLETGTVGGGTASVPTDLISVPFTGSPAFTQFNSTAIALANPGNTVALNDVVLSYTAVATTSGTVKNNDAQAQTFTFSLSVLNGLTTGGSTAAENDIVASFGAATTLAFPSQKYTLLASGGTAVYPASGGSQTATQSSTITGGTVNDFIGTGAFTVDMNTSSGQGIAGGNGHIAPVLSTLVGGTFSIKYDYTLTPTVTPVPEPASVAMFGMGVIGLAALRRRQRS